MDDEDTETDNNNVDALNDLLDGMDNAEDNKDDQNLDDVNLDDDNQDALKDSEDGGDDQDDGDSDDGSDDAEVKRQQKTNAAFAQMRSDNTQLKNKLNKTFEILGIDPNDDDVESKIIEKLAEARKMDPKVLKELEDLRASNNEVLQVRHQDNLRAQLGTLQGYGLSKEEITGFLGQLGAEGLDPMRNTSVNLVQEYMNRNSDVLIGKLVEVRVQEALGKQAEEKAGAHASTPPGKTKKKVDPSDREVNSVQAMDKLLDEIVTTK